MIGEGGGAGMRGCEVGFYLCEVLKTCRCNSIDMVIVSSAQVHNPR